MPSKSPLQSFEVPDVDLWGFIFERKDLPFPEDKGRAPSIQALEEQTEMPSAKVSTVMLRDADTDRTYTFAQTRATAIEFGKGLKSVWEWRKGEVLAFFTPNSIDTPPVMWGTIWAGGVCTLANPGYTADELAFQLKDSGATAIVTQLAMLDVALKAAKEAGISEDRIILLGDGRDSTYKYKHFSAIRNLAGTSRYRRTKSKAGDLVFLPYSSGTTGKPKGVMLSHRNVASNVLMNEIGEKPNMTWKEDKVLAFLPFFHIYGLTVLMHQAIHSGYEMVVMARFDLEKFCKTVQEQKITMVYVAPPVILALSKAPVVSQYDLSSIKMMNSGAAPLTKELVEAMYERIKIPVKQGYGLSETSPTTHMQPWPTWRTKIGSVGVLLSNQEAKYMSPEDKEVPVGDVGELWIRGPNIFMGYLNNEAGTKNAITEDGYFKTGDVGYQDKDGMFYITDRVKELIKYKGFQVPPAELEGYLQSHPKIADAAVIGINDKEQHTEVPRAYIVPESGVKGDDKFAKEISDWISSKVANHKRLRGGVRFIDAVPKSASGKILRRLLKDQAIKDDETARAKL